MVPMIVALICARAGSVGLPDKNFRKMCGKPLIDWTIEEALKCKAVDRVAIITDSGYKHVGCLSFKEPAELASGEVGKWDVWRWAARELEDWGQQDVQIIVDLDVTRPLVKAEDITKVIHRFISPPPDAHLVMGITPARKSPYFDLLEPDQVGALRLSKPYPFTVRQSAIKVWQHAGVYVMDRRQLDRFDSLFADGLVVRGSMLPPECGLDIDDELDWTMVEAVLEQREHKAANMEAAKRGEM